MHASSLVSKRFRSVNALPLLQATFSLGKSFIALRGLSFRPVIVFSLYGRVFALSHGKRVFDFASDVFANDVLTRNSVYGEIFILRGMYSLEKRVPTLANHVFVLKMRFRLCSRRLRSV